MTATDAALCLSWDDGHPADCRVADMLSRHGLRGTFFVPLANVEGLPTLNGQELRDISRQGFEIGAHGLDHRRLTALPRQQARQQIEDGKRRLEDLLGRPVTGFCYPGGRHDRSIRSAVAQGGFAYARTTEMFRLDIGPDPYRMPTTLQLYPHGTPALLRNWARQGCGWKRLTRALRLRQSGLLPCAAGFAGEAADTGGVLHLWGHSWEIANENRWQWLDEILAAIAAVPGVRRADCAGLLS